jgi:hypothetical protein
MTPWTLHVCNSPNNGLSNQRVSVIVQSLKMGLLFQSFFFNCIEMNYSKAFKLFKSPSQANSKSWLDFFKTSLRNFSSDLFQKSFFLGYKSQVKSSKSQVMTLTFSKGLLENTFRRFL